MLVAGKILPFTQQSRMCCCYQGHLRPTLLTSSPLFVRLFSLCLSTRSIFHKTVNWWHFIPGRQQEQKSILREHYRVRNWCTWPTCFTRIPPPFFPPSRTLLRAEHIREFEINFSNVPPDGLASVFPFVAMVTLAWHADWVHLKPSVCGHLLRTSNVTQCFGRRVRRIKLFWLFGPHHSQYERQMVF